MCGSAFAVVPMRRRSLVRKLLATSSLTPCCEATSSGKLALNRIAKGYPPKHGMQWPLATDRLVPMNEVELEELWPDRRAGSRADRKRRPVVHPDLEGATAGLQKVGHDEEPDQQTHDHDLQQLEIESCDYVLQEYEDPWGLLALGLDEEL